MEAPDLFGQFIMSLLAAGGVFGACKANLAATMKNLERVEKKIDDHMSDHAKGLFK